ncbi:hypothetical protein Dimus_017814 [Dionaea muscipula]
MGLSGLESNCRKHPNLKQVPGVCSSCLREKLAKLTPGNDFSSALVYHSSSVSCSPGFSSISSPPASKIAHLPRHRKNGSDAFAGAVPVGFVVHSGAPDGAMAGGGLLNKSRSMTCDPRIGRGNHYQMDDYYDHKDVYVPELALDGEKKKSGIGFWKKLIKSTSKRTKGVLMLQSKTIKEKPYY